MFYLTRNILCLWNGDDGLGWKPIILTNSKACPSNGRIPRICQWVSDEKQINIHILPLVIECVWIIFVQQLRVGMKRMRTTAGIKESISQIYETYNILCLSVIRPCSITLAQHSLKHFAVKWRAVEWNVWTLSRNRRVCHNTQNVIGL